MAQVASIPPMDTTNKETIEESEDLNNDGDLDAFADNRESLIPLLKRLDAVKLKILNVMGKIEVKNHPELYHPTNMAKNLTPETLKNLAQDEDNTLLNFTRLTNLIRSLQSSDALFQRFQADKNTSSVLEKEEEEYLTELLDELREGRLQLIKRIEECNDQNIEILETRASMVDRYMKYRSLFDASGSSLQGMLYKKEDNATIELRRQVRDGDDKINQLRILIQRMMIHKPIAEADYDKETVKRMEDVFLKCGSWPDELRDAMTKKNAKS